MWFRQFSSLKNNVSRLNLKGFQRLYKDGKAIKMLTATDYCFSRLADEHVDSILVGDSLGNVALGYDNTMKVTINDIIHHCKAVAKGSKKAFLIGDMPFGSNMSEQLCLSNAFRIIQEGNMQAVKLEGGENITSLVKSLVNCGIPVMGHVGLNPQKYLMSGYTVKGSTCEDALEVINDSRCLQDAGCFAIVIEAVPEIVAKHISSQLNIPCIGIGAGKYVSGQILVQHDLLGLNFEKPPKFTKRYADLKSIIADSIASYCSDVDQIKFPEENHTYSMQPREIENFIKAISK